MELLPPPSHYHYNMLTRQKLVLLAGLVIAVFFVLAAVILANQRTSWTGKAAAPTAALFSRENSYLFASPIAASANGTSIIRVTVFLLNNQGLGVSNQLVTLTVAGPVTVAKIQPTTDTFGRAIFDVTSNSPGDYTITAAKEEVSLLQKVSVSFR